MKAKSNNSSAMEQPKEGTHLARLVSIVDMGHQPGYEWQGQPVESKYKIRLTYELVDSLLEDGRPHWVSEDVTNSDNEKSTLYLRVKTLNGSMGDLSSMLGNPCMVTVTLNDKGYAKVAGQGGVGGVPAGIDVKELVNPITKFELDNPDMDVFDKLPEFIKTRIMENLDFEGSPLQRQLDMRQ